MDIPLPPGDGGTCGQAKEADAVTLPPWPQPGGRSDLIRKVTRAASVAAARPEFAVPFIEYGANRFVHG